MGERTLGWDVQEERAKCELLTSLLLQRTPLHTWVLTEVCLSASEMSLDLFQLWT